MDYCAMCNSELTDWESGLCSGCRADNLEDAQILAHPAEIDRARVEQAVKDGYERSQWRERFLSGGGMRVFVAVTVMSYETADPPLGVYSTRELAEAALEDCKRQTRGAYDHYEVHEYELDVTGEIEDSPEPA